MSSGSPANVPGEARLSTGNPNLDAILSGGLVPKRPYLIVGPAGVGKTTLALQFLCDGARRGERTLIVTLEEPPNEIRANHPGMQPELDDVYVFDAIPDVMRYERVPFKDIAAVRQSIHFRDVPTEIRKTPELSSVEVTFTALEQTIKMEMARRSFTRLVIDSLTALQYFCMKGFDETLGAQTFLRFLSDLHVTTLLTVESPLEDVESPERLLARGEVRLFRWELDGRTVRAIGVEKFRGSAHDVRLHPYRLGSRGIDINLDVTISHDSRRILEGATLEAVAPAPHLSPMVSSGLAALDDDLRDLAAVGIDVTPVRAELEAAANLGRAGREAEMARHFQAARQRASELAEQWGRAPPTGLTAPSFEAVAAVRRVAVRSAESRGVPTLVPIGSPTATPPSSMGASTPATPMEAPGPASRAGSEPPAPPPAHVASPISIAGPAPIGLPTPVRPEVPRAPPSAAPLPVPPSPVTKERPLPPPPPGYVPPSPVTSRPAKPTTSPAAPPAPTSPAPTEPPPLPTLRAVVRPEPIPEPSRTPPQGPAAGLGGPVAPAIPAGAAVAATPPPIETAPKAGAGGPSLPSTPSGTVTPMAAASAEPQPVRPKPARAPRRSRPKSAPAVSPPVGDPGALPSPGPPSSAGEPGTANLGQPPASTTSPVGPLETPAPRRRRSSSAGRRKASVVMEASAVDPNHRAGAGAPAHVPEPLAPETPQLPTPMPASIPTATPPNPPVPTTPELPGAVVPSPAPTEFPKPKRKAPRRRRAPEVTSAEAGPPPVAPASPPTPPETTPPTSAEATPPATTAADPTGPSGG